MINIIRGKTAFHQLPPTSPQNKTNQQQTQSGNIQHISSVPLGIT